MRCLAPNCTNEIEQRPGNHRSRKYCSEACKVAAYRHRQKEVFLGKEEKKPAHLVKEEAEVAEQAELLYQRSRRTHWFEKQIAIDVLRYRFQQGKVMLRIATGFFTVKGYNLLRSAARNKQMYILVGLDDPGWAG